MERLIVREMAARVIAKARLCQAQASAEAAQRELLAELDAEESATPVGGVCGDIVVENHLSARVHTLPLWVGSVQEEEEEEEKEKEEEKGFC